MKLAQGTRDHFFSQVEKYADTYAFAIRIAPNHPDGKRFLIQLWREDMKIIGTNPFDPLEFHIAFYQNGNTPVPYVFTNAIVDKLKHALNEIRGAIISDIK